MEDTEMTSPSPPTFKSPKRVAGSRISRHPSGSECSLVSTLPTIVVLPQQEDVVQMMSPHESPSFCSSTSSTSISPCNSDASARSLASRVNPFEDDLLAGLQRSFCSPTMMDIKDTPPQHTWSIDHLAHLFPKDIENSPSTHQNAFPVDANMEAQAQADIDKYFSRERIIPTPSPLTAHHNNIQQELTSPKTEDTADYTIPRRKLLLSFGDDLPDQDHNFLNQPVSPISPMDPFRNNHMLSTPPSNLALPNRVQVAGLDLNRELMRCAVTPETKSLAAPKFSTNTPGISPIIDETPHPQYRNTGNGSKKRFSTSSLDDSATMECSPPPAKVSRLSLTENEKDDIQR